MFIALKRIPHITLVTLTVVSLIASRALFALIDDPEGPNLLIVVALAAVIFSVECVGYLFLKRGK
jgi:hypothetical protein